MTAKIPLELQLRHIPYTLFTYAGILPWMLFAVGVGSGGNSLMNQQNLLTKVYFPRLFVPASVIGAALVDTLISLGVFFDSHGVLSRRPSLANYIRSVLVAADFAGGNGNGIYAFIAHGYLSRFQIFDPIHGLDVAIGQPGGIPA